MAMATLAGGCFWCTEAAFARLHGVMRVTSGYSGGVSKNPSYEEVCSGVSGHVEAIQIEFDPALISYENLLEVFFTIHDPTTLNRQGADRGTQYRSEIFCHDKGQYELARDFVGRMERAKVFSNPIVTRISSAQLFYPAEPEHQEYYRRYPDAGYCACVIRPKMEKIEKQFTHLLADASR